jgi:(2Fe-2S) ferredoxin
MTNNSYYKHHVFFCLNERKEPEQSCAHYKALEGFDYCKSKVKKLGLSGPGGVRVNKAGCLDRCAGGPVMVIYPEQTWYTYFDQADIDEIIEKHLISSQEVQRLLLPQDIGR